LGGVEWLLFIFNCLSTPFVKICDVGEKLLPAKCREHYEKVFSEFNEWKEKRGVMTINEEVIDLRLYFSLSY
jgi:hypothetical protein